MRAGTVRRARTIAAGLAVSALVARAAAPGSAGAHESPIACPTFVQLNAVAAGPLALAAADVDGDGLSDLIAATMPAGRDLAVLLGNGNGTFRSGGRVTVGRPVGALTAGDFDGDGRADLAAAEPTDDAVAILLGSGDGTFHLAGTYPFGGGPRSLAAADFDGDGQMDLVVGGAGGITVLLGNGDGTFRPGPSIGSDGGEGGAAAVTAGDFDGDSRVDVAAVYAATGDRVSILVGNGDGTFRAARSYAAGRTVVAVAVGDLDGDRHPDLVVAGGSGVSVLIGNLDGSFQAPLSYGTPSATRAVVAADFNGDDRIDVAAADNVPGVSVLLNTCLALRGGAIFTTAADGQQLPGNRFDTKEAVYLDAGRAPGAPGTAAGLSDGMYVFQVTDATGETVLSTDALACRQFKVQQGAIAFASRCSGGAHASGVDSRRGQTIQLLPYADLAGDDGAYKVWVTSAATLKTACTALGVIDALGIVDCGYAPGNFHGFVQSNSLVEDYQVQPAGPPRQIAVRFFFDRNGDGRRQEDEGWLDGRYVTWEDSLGGSNLKWSSLDPASGVEHEARIEAAEAGTHRITVADQPGCKVGRVEVSGAGQQPDPLVGPQTVTIQLGSRSLPDGDAATILVACR